MSLCFFGVLMQVVAHDMTMPPHARPHMALTVQVVENVMLKNDSKIVQGLTSPRTKGKRVKLLLFLLNKETQKVKSSTIG